jgi:hypothetical protein
VPDPDRLPADPFRLVGLVLPPRRRVQVERPQRSEDERPAGRQAVAQDPPTEEGDPSLNEGSPHEVGLQ